jgi:hypothetical protein
MVHHGSWSHKFHVILERGEWYRYLSCELLCRVEATLDAVVDKSN